MKNVQQMLAGKTVLIAGGTGFFGRALVSYLEKINFSEPPSLILLSRGKVATTSNSGPLAVTHFQADISQRINLELPRIDYIIHAATSSGISDYEEGYLHSTVIEGTKNLLAFASKQNVKGILYVSSGAVYGQDNVEPFPLSETSMCSPGPDDPSQVYGVFKLAAESLCFEFHQSTGIPVIVARCFAFSGRDMDIRGVFALTSFIRNVLDGKDIHINGKGLAVRSYLDQDDLACWILELLLQNQAWDVVNVGSATPYSIKELAEAVASKAEGRKTRIIIEGKMTRENYYVPDVSKAIRKYGLKETKSFSSSLDEMIEAMKSKSDRI